MSKYSLTVLFDADSLQQVTLANLSVVITKHTVKQSNAVAWHVFQPFQNNTVSWDEHYDVYASQSEGPHIVKVWTFNASPGNRYVLQDSGFIQSQQPGVTGGFQMLNETDQTWTIGLMQSAQINEVVSKGIVSAEIVPPHMLDEVVPIEILEVFMMSGFKPGDVVQGPLNTVRGKAIRLQYGGATNMMTIQYNANIGSFVRV